ncbi:GNAT family N-acetyltransferase [Halobacteriales archaeon SW_7_68_16]|nr:MAG: GNAT family N-acetyltransferase [Halobacteriales archaeon SW_7_68_16]
MSGKAVTRDDGGIVAAIAFGPDRTDPDRLWLRYVTVRRDRRGEGIGPDLVRFVVDRATDRGYDRVRIAVNNPYAFEALYRAGFGFTGETTGIAELILDRPRPGPEPDRYRAGFAAFVDRDLSDGERSFVARRRDGTPPTVE